MITRKLNTRETGSDHSLDPSLLWCLLRLTLLALTMTAAVALAWVVMWVGMAL